MVLMVVVLMVQRQWSRSSCEEGIMMIMIVCVFNVHVQQLLYVNVCDIQQ